MNVKILFDVFTFRVYAFSPVVLFSLTVITQMFSQLFVIYTNQTYIDTNVTRLLITMVLCQLLFNYGYRIGEKDALPSNIVAFNYSKLLIIICSFVALGLIPMLFYNKIDSVYGGINVVLGIFRGIGTIGFILVLIYFENRKLKFSYSIILLLVAIFPLFYFAYYVKGSREGMYALVVVILFFICRRKPKWKNPISVIFVLIFLVAVFFTASITDVRRVNNYKESGALGLTDIDYVGNFKATLIDRDVSNGMDLGNASLLMDNVSQNTAYDFGAFIWNGFVYNYVPARFIGENLKESMRFDLFDVKENVNLEIAMTNGITTKTGYYDAYKSFSYFGTILFGLIGYIIGLLKRRSEYSGVYLMLFVSSLTVIPNMITHSLQFMLGRWELFVLLFPVFYFFIYKKNKKTLHRVQS